MFRDSRSLLEIIQKYLQAQKTFLYSKNVEKRKKKRFCPDWGLNPGLLGVSPLCLPPYHSDLLTKLD